MSFWERVVIILDQKEIPRKELIISTGIESSLISKGLSDTSIPRTETALKIAQFLGTTVEYLVTGNSPHSLPPNISMADFKQYKDFLVDMAKLSDANRNMIRQLIMELLDDTEYSSPE